MNFLDIIVIIPLIWGAFKGFKNGLISEGGTIVALVLGIWAAVSFSDALTPFIEEYTSVAPEHQKIVAFAGTFILVLIACYFVTRIILKFFQAIKLAWLDKLMGVLFGATKYLVVISMIFFLVNSLIKTYSTKPIEVVETSIFFKPLAEGAEAIIGGKLNVPQIEKPTIFEPLKQQNDED